MRSNTRIAPIIQKFSQLWYQFPDLRYGQIVAVIEDECRRRGCRDSFYVEDDKISEIIDEVIEKMTVV